MGKRFRVVLVISAVLLTLGVVNSVVRQIQIIGEQDVQVHFQDPIILCTGNGSIAPATKGQSMWPHFPEGGGLCVAPARLETLVRFAPIVFRCNDNLVFHYLYDSWDDGDEWKGLTFSQAGGHDFCVITNLDLVGVVVLFVNNSEAWTR